MVMNSALRKMIISKDRLPDLGFFACRIHDAWTACVAYATGEVVFDEKAHMDFRRHEMAYSDEFAPGRKINLIQTYKRKLQRYRRRGVIKNGVSMSANNLLVHYSDYLDDEEKENLKLISEYNIDLASKIRLLKSEVFRNSVKGVKGMVIYKVITGIL